MLAGCKIALCACVCVCLWQVGGGGPDCTSTNMAGSECRAQKFGKLWDNNTQTPWYRFQESAATIPPPPPGTPKGEGLWQQGYYDDARSVAMKYALSTLPADSVGAVQGLFIWPLNGNSISTCGWCWDTLVKSVGIRPNAKKKEDGGPV